MSTKTLQGTVTGTGVVIRRATLHVADAKPAVSRIDLPFTIEVGGDTLVDVETTGATEVGPLVETRGTWEELASHDAAEGFRAKPPAPDARVRLVWAVVRGGDHVVVHGQVTKTEPSSGGYRDRKTTTPRVVLARHISRGKEAFDVARRLEETSRPVQPQQYSDPLPRFLQVVGVLGILAAVIGPIAADDLPFALDWIALGLGVALGAIVLHRRVAPSYVLFDAQRLGIEWTPAFLGGTFAMWAVLEILPLLDDRPWNLDGVHRRYSGPIGFGLTAAWALVLLAFSLFWERFELRAAKRLLSAPLHSSPPMDGEWGLSEGRVEATSLHVEGAAVACASIFEESWRDGSSPNVTAYGAMRAPFSLRCDDGTSITVKPSGLVGAGTLVWGKGDPSDAKPTVLRHAHVIPKGARAIVLGRMQVSDDGPVLEPGLGLESLVVFGAPDPRRALRTRLISGVVVLALLGLFATTLAALTAYHPFLPPLYSTDD